MSLRAALAPKIVGVLFTNITTRYPFHDSHVFALGDPPREPLASHPAFGNSFDWHSSVHSHWTALKVVEHFASREKPVELPRLEAAVAENLRPEQIAAEVAYLDRHPSYERPYGWGWAMRLATVAPQALPLAAWVAGAAQRWLSILPYPVRHGVHTNTAFALRLMLDAARALQMPVLELTIVECARRWYATDRNWPAGAERSGNDFLSPALAEADLMHRVFDQRGFVQWWRAFLPEVTADSPLLIPADVPLVADGHVLHLHGLNLSRAEVAARIATIMGDRALLEAAKRLYAASADRSVRGQYAETHWLPTFAWNAAESIDSASHVLDT
jgi:hypothetical protein